MVRHFYAVLWPYGVASTVTRDGRTVPCRNVYRFDSCITRDEWVEQSNSYRANNGYREGVLRSDLRRAELDPQYLTDWLTGKPVAYAYLGSR